MQGCVAEQVHSGFSWRLGLRGCGADQRSTRQPEGRKLLVDPARGFLRALATQLRSHSLTRRRGCAAAFRNCVFGAQVCRSTA